MKRCYRVFAILIVLSLLAAAAVYAGPVYEGTITLGRDPEPPICTMPNNAVTLFWDITHLSTPNFVHYQLEDPTRTVIIEQQDYPGSAGINVVRNWVVPPGSAEGKYWVRVEYWSFQAGNEANAEVTFYVCNATGEICASKYEDVNLDGTCNPGGGELQPDVPVPNWWICITTPVGDTFCQRTDVNGRVCWYNLPAGNYTVFEPAVAGWHPVGVSSYNVVVGATPVDVTFCNAQDQTSTEESSWGGIKSLFR